MTKQEFYGDCYENMKKAEKQLLDLINVYVTTQRKIEGVKQVVYYCSRIKEPESMLKKLERKGFNKTSDAALRDVYDAIGVRVVCAFVEDVYRIIQWFYNQSIIEIIEEKDYFSYPKPNGYRSYHILLRIVEGDGKGYLAEIQVRTIANDFWATVEHQLKYKKDIVNEKLIRSELKRCADEIASVDMSMQTIRDIISESR